MNDKDIFFKDLNLIEVFKNIWDNLNFRKKYQFILIFLVMFLSSLLEIATLTTVIPLIKVLISPKAIVSNELILFFVKKLGYSTDNVSVILLSIIFIIILLISASLRVINTKLNTLYAASVGSFLSCKAYKNILQRPYLEHLLTDSSAIITSNTTHMEKTIVSINFFLQLLTSFLITLSISLTLVYIEWSILLISIITLGIAYYLQILLTKNKLLKNSKDYADASKEQVKTIQEGLGTFRELIIHNQEKIYLNKYKSYDYLMRKVMAENTFIKLYPKFVIEFLGITLIIISGLILSNNPEKSQYAIAALGSFALGCQRLLPSIQQIYASWAGIKANYGSLISVISILNKKNFHQEKINFNSGRKQKFKSLELKNISIKYGQNNKYVLRDFNLRIKKGQKVGICGETGCGKSTLMDIMMGLIKPTSGKVLFNGLDINTNLTARNNLYCLIAHVPQTIYLINNSIKQNIALGEKDENIDMKKIIECAKKAKIHESIINMKNGYDSFVGERGNIISGGQRQRIAIARALYRNSEILFLDEATSALDEKTEEEINSILESVKKDITIIKISHRLKTISNCEIIIDLNKKKILTK